jgi:type IV pilus assembly protein PilA
MGFGLAFTAYVLHLHSMNSATQLQLLQQLRKRQGLIKQGFTLVELMIVVAIVGLLSAVALPQFLSARDRADAKAKVGELVGIAKECSTFNAEADMTPSTITGPINTVICGGSIPSDRTLSSRTWRVNVGVECVGTSLTTNQVKMQIFSSGRMVCS